MTSKVALLPLLFSAFTQSPAQSDIAPNTLSPIVFAQEESREKQVNIETYTNGTKSVYVSGVEFVHQIRSLPEYRLDEIRTTACGPSALTMAMNYATNRDYKLMEVIQKLPDSVYVKGSMFYDLYSGPEYFGLEIEKLDFKYSDIFQALENGNPVILNIQNYDGITGHAVVVVGMEGFDSKNGSAETLIVHDPFTFANRRFEVVDSMTLLQPGGKYLNYLGILQPFYIVKTE